MNGKRRKYYAATADGRKALCQMLRPIRELVEELVKGRGPRHLE